MAPGLEVPAPMNLQAALKTSLDELRMQMLGAQALFGFQIQGLFQDNFLSVPGAARWVDAVGLALMVTVLGLILAVPCQHRIVEEGEATARIFCLSLRYAKYAMAPLAAAVSCDVFVALSHPFGIPVSALLAAAAFLAALIAWYGVGLAMRRDRRARPAPFEEAPVSLHEKITQLLTEARVILPGAQALLGFQFVVMMTQAFDRLPQHVQVIHVIALLSLVVAILLLICPAAIHRLAFEGRDDVRLLGAGSALVTTALIPLTATITCDVWVALYKLTGSEVMMPTVGATVTAAMLLAWWFVIPWAIRAKVRRPRRSASRRHPG
jgi:hypothetical protein